MQSFHSLAIDDIRPETAESASFRFAVPAALRATFAFTPGQHLTLRATLNGEELRRSYSICSAAEDGELRIAIKRVSGGRFSNWALDTLRSGDRVDVMAPSGNFGPPASPGQARRYVAFAAGSGITPIVSIVSTVLAREPHAEVTLVYGNRHADAIMFKGRLDALAARHAGRMKLLHVLSGAPDATAAFPGRIDRPRLDALLTTAIDPRVIDHFLICGPGSMVDSLRDGLIAHGVGTAAIRVELFTTPVGEASPARTAPATSGATATVTVLRDGITRAFETALNGDNLIDAAEAAGIELPYSCKGGVCATCRCKLTAGQVEMAQNFALSQEELDGGFILACQAHPTSPQIALDFDTI